MILTLLTLPCWNLCISAYNLMLIHLIELFWQLSMTMILIIMLNFISNTFSSFCKPLTYGAASTGHSSSCNKHNNKRPGFGNWTSFRCFFVGNVRNWSRCARVSCHKLRSGHDLALCTLGEWLAGEQNLGGCGRPKVFFGLRSSSNLELRLKGV